MDIPENERPASLYVIMDMMRLGWKPAAGETPEKFREWLLELLEIN